MQNILGRMADLMSSVLTRSPLSTSTPSSGNSDEMKKIVLDLRTRLTNAIYHGKDCTEIIMRLAELDCAFSDRYAVLQVIKLLSLNNKSLEELTHIVCGLASIIKYAQHLVKKSEDRRDLWRVINLNNAVVQKKIKPMKGFDTVLQQLGYTIVIPNGFSFPVGVEPNLMVIINLMADMMLFRKEIKEYILGRHLHPNYLLAHIPLETQNEVQTAQLNGLKCEDLSEVSSQISLIEPSQLEDKQMQVSAQNVNASLTPDSKLVIQPERTKQECNNNSVSNDKYQSSISATETLDVIPISTNVDLCFAQESSAISNIKEGECEAEKLQSTANVPIEAIQDLVTSTNDQDTVGTGSSSGMSSSLRLACTVCGDEAIVYCEDCTKKPLCQSCNTNWHKHPQRQGHIQKSISVFDFASPESMNPVHIDGAYGISAQTNTHSDRISKKQQTHVVKQKTPIKITSSNSKEKSSDVPKGLLDNQNEVNPMVFFMPHQMQNEQNQLPDYHNLQHMNSHKQHLPQSVRYTNFSSHGFDNHPPSFYNQVPYNNARLVYPGQQPGHHVGSNLEMYTPRMAQKQIFDNSHLVNSYPTDMAVLHHVNTLPNLQQQLNDAQRQAAMLQLHQSPAWSYHGMGNRVNNPYQYNRGFVESQHVEDISPVSFVPTSVMSPSMFQQTNPITTHPSTNQMFSVSPQHAMRPMAEQYTKNNQLLHHLDTFGSEPQINKQGIYNATTTGHTFNPTFTDVNLMGMSSVYIGNQNSLNLPGQYQTLSLTKSAGQGVKHLVASGSSLALSNMLIPNPYIVQLNQILNIEVRSAKCDEYILIVMNEIKALDQLINKAMEEDVEVCETDQFRTWNKQKAFLMQQKRQLEEYRHHLEDETALLKLNLNEEMSQQIHYPPEIDLSTKTPNKVQPASVLSHENVSNVANSEENITFSKNSNHKPTVSNMNSSAVVTNISPIPVKNSIKTDDIAQSTIARGLQHSKPPHIPQRVPQEVDILNITFPPPKILSVPESAKNWQCQHCTFLNPAKVHLCLMCNNPLVYKVSHDESNGSNSDNNINESKENLMKGDRFLNMLEDIKNDEESKKGKVIGDKNNDDNIHNTNTDQTHLIGSRIFESQEKIMTKNKRVQQDFLQEQVLVTKMNSEALSSSSVEATGNHKQRREIIDNYSSESSNYNTPSSSSPSPHSPHINSQLHKSYSADRINVETRDDDKCTSSLGSSDGKLENTIARFNEVSMIDSMQAQGAEFAKLIKIADKEGFDVEALQIALSYSDFQNVDPVEWLKQNWKKNVNMIVAMVIAAGNKQQQNTVGELSVQEAESAYTSCHGNIQDAVQMCINQRTELYEHLDALGEYPREEILQVMFQCCGNKESAEELLIESIFKPFLESIWAEKETDSRNRFTFDSSGPLPEMCHSFSTSIIFHGNFQKMMKDKSLNIERRIRMIFVEGKLKSWGRAELVIKILDNDLPDENISLEDVVEAVRNCQDKASALAYLQQECELCFTNFPMSKIRNLNICQCKMCEQCLTKNFEIGIREKHVRHWTCPLCSLPDMNDADVASDYLHFLLLLLQPLVAKDLQNLFEIKVRDWHLQKDVSFRWCAHCAEGFLAENQGEHLRMTCPHCQKKTCFNCKKQWEPQHEGLTCEQFNQWKIDNDPNNQSEGLAKHLDENGIDCPTCKMRFALAKGGCMHFKCPQCGHEFCSGCNEPFHQKDVCIKYKICKKLGLHCHCPRDCFSYLRDRPVHQLQQLLKLHDVPFNINAPEDQTDPLHCPVMEQKEFDTVKKDEKCGKETVNGQAGLCEIHYKEYLVYIINRNKLDPVVLMTKDEMVNLLIKYDIQTPFEKQNETPSDYVAQLIKVVQKDLPLRR